MQSAQTRAVLTGLFLVAIAGITYPLHAAPQAATLRRVAVLGRSSGVEVEIVASGPVTPQAQAVTGPDRIVIDFPNALPGSVLRHFAVNRGEVKGIRTGLFSANPPVTRVVLDLKSAQPYQVTSAGNRVIVKVDGGGENAGGFDTQFEVVTSRAVSSERTVPAAKAPAQVNSPRRIEVEFRHGKLSIWADRATLAEVLKEVHRKTGADIPIPAGAEQELVVANMEPGPARDVLASLLNGSRFNFIMIGSDTDPNRLKSVILMPRPGTAGFRPSNYQPNIPTQTVATVPTPPVPSSLDPQPDTDEAPGEDSSNQQPN
jgi:hypothetical protein